MSLRNRDSSEGAHAATNADKCPIVDCSRPECLHKCGWLQWFKNTSRCTVEFQYQREAGGLWHSLGTYGPGEAVELGGGALYLPKEVNLRVIRSPKPGSTDPPLVVVNYGRLGDSLPSLAVTPSHCAPETDTQTEDNGTQKKWCLPPAVIIVLAVVTVVAFVLAMVAIFHRRPK